MSDVEWGELRLTRSKYANYLYNFHLNAEEFEVEVAPQAKPSDRWDGEDEEDVKDNWDDEEDENDAVDAIKEIKNLTEDAKGNGVMPSAKKKKKKLEEIIAEKEAKKIEAAERKKKQEEEEEEDESKPITAKEKLEEKLRLQKIQGEADLVLINELVGKTEKETVTSFDNIDLTSTDGLELFRLAITDKVKAIPSIEGKSSYVCFVENLCRDLCNNMDSDAVKRVSTVINAVYNEKLRSGKQIKGKKKGTGKVKLFSKKGNIGMDDFEGMDNVDYTDEMEDFI